MSGRNNLPDDDIAGIGLANREQPVKGIAAMKNDQQRKADAPAAQPAQGENQCRPGILRDGFSMPEADYRLIGEIRASCIELGVLPTKSGILRAGLHALHKMDPQELVQLIKSLEPVKTGRPAKK